MEPIVHTVHEPSTGTWQYIVADPETKHALIIDSVLDFDSSKNAIGIESANVLLAKVAEEGYTVDAVLETHLHADHISASGYLCKVLKTKQSAAPKICIGSGISGMQKLFGERYRIAEEEWNGAFDRTYSDGETFPLGKLAVEVMHLPGHTPVSQLTGKRSPHRAVG